MINRLDDIERRCHAWTWRPSIMCVHPTYINIGFPVALLFTISSDSKGCIQRVYAAMSFHLVHIDMLAAFDGRTSEAPSQ